MKDRKRICAPSILGDLGRYAPVRALKLEQALIMTRFMMKHVIKSILYL